MARRPRGGAVPGPGPGRWPPHDGATRATARKGRLTGRVDSRYTTRLVRQAPLRDLVLRSNPAPGTANPSGRGGTGHRRARIPICGAPRLDDDPSKQERRPFTRGASAEGRGRGERAGPRRYRPHDASALLLPFSSRSSLSRFPPPSLPRSNGWARPHGRAFPLPSRPDLHGGSGGSGPARGAADSGRRRSAGPAPPGRPRTARISSRTATCGTDGAGKPIPRITRPPAPGKNHFPARPGRRRASAPARGGARRGPAASRPPPAPCRAVRPPSSTRLAVHG